MSLREREKESKRFRIGQAVPSGHRLWAASHEESLYGDLQDLARQRSGQVGHGEHDVGYVAW